MFWVQDPSHGDGSSEYIQHMFWMRNKKKRNYTLFTEGLMSYGFSTKQDSNQSAQLQRLARILVLCMKQA